MDFHRHARGIRFRSFARYDLVPPPSPIRSSSLLVFDRFYPFHRPIFLLIADFQELRTGSYVRFQKAMKVLMLSLDQGIFDPASRVFARMRAYADFVDEFHIIIPSFSSTDRIAPFSIGNCTMYPARTSFRPMYLLHAYRIGLSIIRSRSFALHSDCITAQDAFPTGIVAWALRCRTGIPFELQAHVPFFNPRFIFGSFFQFIQYIAGQFLYPRADRVRAVSRAIASYMTTRLRIPEDRVSVIPVFSDFPLGVAFLPSGAHRGVYPRFRFIVRLIARFVPEKNIAMAIRAAILLRLEYPQIGWIITGAGPCERSLRRLASPASDTVVFEPWAPNPSGLHQSADLYACTSWYEGWGLSIVEAMRSGVPIVTTSVGCVPQLMRSPESCLIVPPGDSEALAAAVTFLYRYPEERARMASVALDVARATYTDIRSHSLRVVRAWSSMASL